MSYQPYYITQYEQETGLENYFQSFLLPEKAFPVIEDAYCWRGRVKKRGGVFLLGRLRRILTGITLTNAAIGGNYAVADLLADAALGLRATEPNAEIEAGSLVVAIGALTLTDDGLGNLSDGLGDVGTINYVTGAMVLVLNPPLGFATPVKVTFSYFPALPVMGLRNSLVPGINYEYLIPFDQKYAYAYDYTTDEFIELPSTAATTWTGNTAQLFWTTNYNVAGATTIIWATNFNGAVGGDPIRYYNGTTWTAFTPPIDLIPNYLHGCLAMLPFKERLVCFNTWEGLGGMAPTSVNFAQRIRWNTALSDPTVVANWLAVPGEGGFFDIPTDEPIISVEYLKDVILIKCVNSSWKLLYTGDQVAPFTVQKINTNFGASSPFSLIPFDDGVFSFGRQGITTDDSTAVDRIDLNIPDEYLSNQPAPFRTYGIRDYINELAFWSYTYLPLNIEDPVNPNFNNQVMVFNYRNNSYARFNDSFTCFGKFFIETPTAKFPPSVRVDSTNFIAGNQQGFVEMLNVQVLNSPSLAITAITSGAPAIITVPNHNFNTGIADYWVRITGIIGTGAPGTNPTILNTSTTQDAYHLFSIAPNLNTFFLETWDPTTNAFIPVPLIPGGTYLGGGKITIVQNFDIMTKVFSPFYEQGKQNLVPYIDFLLDTTTDGQLSCVFYENENPLSINDPLVASNQGLLGNNDLFTSAENTILYPNQGSQTKIWHRFFSPFISQNFQLQLKMDNIQMSSYDITNSDFVMHAMTLYLSPNARMTA